MDAINKFLKKNHHVYSNTDVPAPTKRVVCKDGFSVSIQANRYSYCNPIKDKAWPYTKVELGYPNELDNLVEDYAEDAGSLDTVYGFVPIDIVNELIKKHGGIVNE